MKVILGLGNPGRQYEATRHNVGWWVLDHLADVWHFDGWKRNGEAMVSTATVGGAHLGFLHPHLVADAFLLSNDFHVALRILGSDGGGALEHHVFEQVSDAGDTGTFVGAADMGHPAPGYARVIVALEQEHFQPV